jgi:putative methyltransferase (TIGR04325 family)
MKALLRDLTPPLLWKAARVISQKLGIGASLSWQGDYASWEEAQRDCGQGYSDEEIIRVTARNTAVLRESLRSSSDLNSRSLRLLAALTSALRIGSDRTLHVVDFGGAMGGHYFSLRRFLSFPKVRWSVIELPATVQEAKKNFGSDELSFFSDLGEVSGPIDALLISSSLQYCPDPWKTFATLAATAAPVVIVDRIPLLQGERDRLTRQTVPREIYSARYPAWFLSESRFLSEAQKHGFKLALRWRCPEDVLRLDGKEIMDQGFLLTR